MGFPLMIPLGGFLQALTPNNLKQVFFQWVQGINQTVKGMIAIDGKTLRRSHDHLTGKKTLNMVSAWAVENSLVLAQIATKEKPNEITAIPLLLQQLALTGCIVTIDAIGSTNEDRGTDY